MGKRIDVIIPFYNQVDKLRVCLSSISVQTVARDVDVTIIDDASDFPPSEILDFFRAGGLSIRVKRLSQNRGPGYARQVGLDITSNPYVTFVDADDTLENVFALEFLRLQLEQKKTCAVFSSFVEECSNGIYLPHIKDNTWIFGKLYDREFLERNGIVFNDSRANEDKGFNCAVLLCAQKPSEPKIHFIDKVTYVWKWNGDSITRKNNFEYNGKDLSGFADNTAFAMSIARRAGVDEEILKRQAAVTLDYLYFRLLENQRSKTYDTQELVGICRKFFEEECHGIDMKHFEDALPVERRIFEKRGVTLEEEQSFTLTDFFGLLGWTSV